MADTEAEDPLTLSGENFYRMINDRHGRSVEQILRFFDIDSYLVLAGVRECHIFDILEKPNDDNTSEEAMRLKKEVCCFVDDDVLLKIGTKRKMILLLKDAHSVSKGDKRLRSLSSSLSNRHGTQRLNNQSEATLDEDSNANDIDLERHRDIIEHNLINTLIKIKNSIHGITRADITYKDFQIGLDESDESGEILCWIQCVCGNRVKLFLRKKRFQFSNFVKHLRNESDRTTGIYLSINQRAGGSSSALEKENEQSSTQRSSDENVNVKEVEHDDSSNDTSQRIRTERNQLSHSDDEGPTPSTTVSTITWSQTQTQTQTPHVLPRTGQSSSSTVLSESRRSNKKNPPNSSMNTSTTPPNIRSIKSARKQAFDSEDSSVVTLKSKRRSNKRRLSEELTSSSTFLSALMETINTNSHRPSNNFTYSDRVFKFATCLFILAGRYAYNYLRMNLMYALPSIQTIGINWLANAYREADFRFDECSQYLDSIESKYVFLSEDCSAIIPKVEYDAVEDYFNGFTTPMVNGIPSHTAFKCSSFDDLKNLFETTELAALVNAHCVQPLSSSSSPTSPSAIVLSAYGTDNRITSIDILKRWLMIFREFSSRGVRVIGFSTDGDPKFLRSMRLALNFFVRTRSFDLNDHPSAFTIDLPLHWRSWFFLDVRQLLLFMQDGIHLCTKMRNRLYSKTARLTMGNYVASIEHLYDLVNDNNKIDHGLSKSDLNIRDKQNFHSCQKLCDEKVLNMLMCSNEHRATYIYLLIINLLIDAYTNSAISLSSRIYCAWIVVFFVRLWRIWLHVTKSSHRKSVLKTDRNHFITTNAQSSIEINAHILIYIFFLQYQQIIPLDLSKCVHLFSSQACENVFRNARALSGVYSTRINFTMKQFLKRINKLNVLTEIKQSEMNNDDRKILFPMHQKLRRLHKENDDIYLRSDANIDVNSLERIIFQAFAVAQEMANAVGMSDVMIANDLFDIQSSSTLAKQLLESSAINEQGSMDDDDDRDDDSSDDETHEDVHDVFIYDADQSDGADDECTITFENLQSTAYSGIRLTSSISTTNRHNYFPLVLNNKQFFIHKQTATWYLQNKQQRLSCDRLRRVQGKEDF